MNYVNLLKSYMFDMLLQSINLKGIAGNDEITASF